MIEEVVEIRINHQVDGIPNPLVLSQEPEEFTSYGITEDEYLDKLYNGFGQQLNDYRFIFVHHNNVHRYLIRTDSIDVVQIAIVPA